MKFQEDSDITPKALLDRPTLHRRWEYPKEVFDDLGGSRRYTAAGAANIPFSEFYLYSVAHNFTDLDRLDVWEDLATIDTIYLSELTKRQKAQQQKGT